MRRAHIKYVAYICDKQTMHCAGAKGCGKSCFHTICEECAANKDSVKLAKDFFDAFNLTVVVKPTAENKEDLFEVWLEEKKEIENGNSN